MLEMWVLFDAYETRNLSLKDAFDAMEVHDAFHAELVYGGGTSKILDTLADVAISGVEKLFGATAGNTTTVAKAMVDIADKQNASAIQSYIYGGELAFKEITKFLINNPRYTHVEAQFLFYDRFYSTKYNQQQKYVQGNRQEPHKGYKVLRVKTSNWPIELAKNIKPPPNKIPKV
ncbi:hypothetical protein [Paucisalibacillus globulus]|uniref:hypothetical protein n=1 Tax=Paucisalibacillus globulus TaxID=351095 RepID=UPI00114518AE|nr:hypothetical protein [Paucisalibacillus globulus]